MINPARFVQVLPLDAAGQQDIGSTGSHVVNEGGVIATAGIAQRHGFGVVDDDQAGLCWNWASTCFAFGGAGQGRNAAAAPPGSRQRGRPLSRCARAHPRPPGRWRPVPPPAATCPGRPRPESGWAAAYRDQSATRFRSSSRPLMGMATRRGSKPVRWRDGPSGAPAGKSSPLIAAARAAMSSYPVLMEVNILDQTQAAGIVSLVRHRL